MTSLKAVRRRSVTPKRRSRPISTPDTYKSSSEDTIVPEADKTAKGARPKSAYIRKP